MSRDARSEPVEAVHRLTGKRPRAVRSDGTVVLADGRIGLLKSTPSARQVAAEVAGLRWLAEPSE
ncbi:MAG: hypothetical protein J2P19_27245, partial [Pseudonocardia sp.]|nr:hypothetical protein [Pseudonocardia sp.]